MTWVNIGSGKDLLPDGTKSLPEPILTYHQLVSWYLHDNVFPGSTNDTNLFDMFENFIIKITTAYSSGQFSMQKHIVLNMTNLFVKEISIEHCTVCPCLWCRINCLYDGLAMKNHPAIMYNNYDSLSHGYIHVRQEDEVNGIRWGIWLPENDIWNISIIAISVKMPSA